MSIADQVAKIRFARMDRRLAELRRRDPARYRYVMLRMAEMLEAKDSPEARTAGRAIRADLETEGTP